MLQSPFLLNDQNSWHFINGQWARGSDGIFQPAVKHDDDDELGVQGYRFAFCKGQGFNDLQATFRVRHNAYHSDAGLIFRASDPQHFYMLHFPDCGQASRCENFWVAVSKMDQSGVLNIVKLSQVRRVASHPYGPWHDVEMQLTGARLEVRIDSRGIFQTDGLDDLGPGYVGLMSFANAQIHQVAIQGQSTAVLTNWPDEDRRKPCWFYPCTDTEFGTWQRPMDLVRVGDQLLLNYAVQERPYEGKITSLLSRSSDNGRTWSRGRVLQVPSGDDQWYPPRMHMTPVGRLIAVVQVENGFRFTQSNDVGQTWSPLSAVEVKPRPTNLECLNMSPHGMLNLADGSILMMLYGRNTSSSNEMGAYTFAAYHVQAYISRSSDDGQTWSKPVQIENRGQDKVGNRITNLDLTEISD